MANVVVTSDSTSILVEFNDSASVLGLKRRTWRRADVININLRSDESIIEVTTSIGQIWLVSYNSVSGALIIDSVNGVAPTSNADLFTKLRALMV
jgi:hypothetical protein